jgi:tetratricopeptide (TPR) repeat protein
LKTTLIAGASALALACILYFAFSNKPPQISVYDERREKLIDSLQYPNGDALLAMHGDMQKADGETKTALLEQLSNEWLALGQPSIGADYLRQMADHEPSYENYMRAGTALNSLIDYEADEQVRVNVVYGARYCYEKALEFNPEDIDARIGLASVLVGSNDPMQGIMMLREIDSQYPGNIKANLELGKFSVLSGQYDKAIERFAVVLQKDSLNLQALYLMAQAYVGIQDTLSAIQTLEKTSTLTSDSLILNQIRLEINNLK